VVPASYRGIDAVSDFVDAAKNTAPDWAQFEVGDPLVNRSILDFGAGADIVILSGVLVSMPAALGKKLLLDCWDVANEVLVFNFLDAPDAEEIRRGISGNGVPVFSITKDGQVRARPAGSFPKGRDVWLWMYGESMLKDWVARRFGQDCNTFWQTTPKLPWDKTAALYVSEESQKKRRERRKQMAREASK
jgi:hypothetical protein